MFKTNVWSEDYERCACGSVVARNRILCIACEKSLLEQLNSQFTEEERLYLKEVYYLSP